MKMPYWLGVCIFLLLTYSDHVSAELIISKIERYVDLSSPIVRVSSTLKIANVGPSTVSEFLLAFSESEAKSLAFLKASTNEGKPGTKHLARNLSLKSVTPVGTPPDHLSFSVALPQPLGEGDILTLDTLAVFTHRLHPFPEKIKQSDTQLILYEDTALFLTPYPVKVQSLILKLPDARIESYTELQNTTFQPTEIKYGPYTNTRPFSRAPVVVHFELNRPITVAQELVREIEISHWGSIQVTEHYNIAHGGSKLTGEFSRLDFQARPEIGGAALSIRYLMAKLPRGAHSIYYRDEIGNISTSHMFGLSKKVELIIEPRYPVLGGWRTAFSIGYGLPLNDFLFELDGKRLLNFSFASPLDDLIVDNHIVKVILPEGARDVSVSIPFAVKLEKETKISHLDLVGRPVVVLAKTNVVPEHNLHFQVYYKFNRFLMLKQPLLLGFGFFFIFTLYILHSRIDLSISKSSASYMLKLQKEEVREAAQRVQGVVSRCFATYSRLDVSLRDLSKSGNVQACKAIRRETEGVFRELTKDMRSLLASLQGTSAGPIVIPQVELIVSKEKEVRDAVIAKHSFVVDSYEKKLRGGDIDGKVALQQQKINSLKQEIEDLLDQIDDM